MKTANLKGAALSWAVAKCEGLEEGNYMKELDIQKDVDERGMGIVVPSDREYLWLKSSPDWTRGGRLIEREKISLTVDSSGLWIAFNEYNYAEEKRFMQCDKSPLIAAMRCYVASKLGDDIEIPETLEQH